MSSADIGYAGYAGSTRSSNAYTLTADAATETTALNGLIDAATALKADGNDSMAIMRLYMAVLSIMSDLALVNRSATEEELVGKQDKLKEIFDQITENNQAVLKAESAKKSGMPKWLSITVAAVGTAAALGAVMMTGGGALVVGFACASLVFSAGALALECLDSGQKAEMNDFGRKYLGCGDKGEMDLFTVITLTCAAGQLVFGLSAAAGSAYQASQVAKAAATATTAADTAGDAAALAGSADDVASVAAASDDAANAANVSDDAATAAASGANTTETAAETATAAERYASLFERLMTALGKTAPDAVRQMELLNTLMDLLGALLQAMQTGMGTYVNYNNAEAESDGLDAKASLECLQAEQAKIQALLDYLSRRSSSYDASYNQAYHAKQRYMAAYFEGVNKTQQI